MSDRRIRTPDETYVVRFAKNFGNFFTNCANDSPTATPEFENAAMLSYEAAAEIIARLRRLGFATVTIVKRSDLRAMSKEVAQVWQKPTEQQINERRNAQLMEMAVVSELIQ
jgi:hypothetical protein